MGWPVDLESAYSGDELYLLQCRLVTTLDDNSAEPEDESETDDG
jgi:phosphoenolpyruvate synthase/pyruvate phosphate dikinase